MLRRFVTFNVFPFNAVLSVNKVVYGLVLACSPSLSLPLSLSLLPPLSLSLSPSLFMSSLSLSLSPTSALSLSLSSAASFLAHHDGARMKSYLLLLKTLSIKESKRQKSVAAEYRLVSPLMLFYCSKMREMLER